MSLYTLLHLKCQFKSLSFDSDRQNENSLLGRGNNVQHLCNHSEVSHSREIMSCFVSCLVISGFIFEKQFISCFILNSNSPLVSGHLPFLMCHRSDCLP